MYQCSQDSIFCLALTQPILSPGDTDHQRPALPGRLSVARVENPAAYVDHDPADGQVPAAHVRAQHHHHPGHGDHHQRLLPRAHDASHAALDAAHLSRGAASAALHEAAQERAQALVAPARRCGRHIGQRYQDVQCQVDQCM